MLKYNYQVIIKLIESLQNQNKVYYLQNGQLFVSKGDICLYEKLGKYIDVIWQINRANMILIPSQDSESIQSYQRSGNIQLIKGVQFRHAYGCPFISQNSIKSQKFYKPCACVLISETQKQQVLLTRRKLTLKSFPGAWVLPGGHLQKGQTLIEGGLRQTKQQVGLDIQTVQIDLSHPIMAWQSAYFLDNKIISSNIVIFFPAYIKTQYEVLCQQQQIEEYKWKSIKDQSNECNYVCQKMNGYGEAHLNYLSYYRNKIHNIQQTKKWILLEQKQNQNIKQILNDNQNYSDSRL